MDLDSADLSDNQNDNEIVDPELTIALPESEKRFDRKFIITKDVILSPNAAIYFLRHPRFGSKALFLIVSSEETFGQNDGANPSPLDSLFEVLSIEHGKRSIFYGDSIIENGSIKMFSPFHPAFIALPYLSKNALNSFKSIDDWMSDEKFPATRLLFSSNKLLETLKQLSDIKGVDEEQYFRYNEMKTLDWLEGRFKILKASLVKHSTIYSKIREDEDTLDRYVFGILCDFIPMSLESTLKDRLKIKDVEEFDPVQDILNGRIGSAERKRSINDGKIRKMVDETGETGSARKRKSTPTVNTRRLQEASKGTHSIKSFFGR